MDSARQMRSERVTVVIPTVNRPRMVVRAVNSALRQSHAPIEVIVVHDGPDEAALAGVRDIRDERVRILRTPKPSGDAGATARNVGVRSAQGDWIAFLDDDDEWLPNKLEAQICIARDHPAGPLVISGRVERRSPGSSQFWPLRTMKPGERVAEYLFLRRAPGEGWLPTPTLMTTRELALEVAFTEGMKKYEDYDWLLRLEACGARFVVAEQVVAIVHVDPAEPSMSKHRDWRASLRWARTRREHLGERAFSAFLLTEVSRDARRDLDVRALAEILRAAFAGRPRSREVLRAATMWLLPLPLVRVVNAFR